MKALASSFRPAFLTASLSVSVLAGLAALTPTEAQACGGTFCEAGPTVMPVDQTGENILFVRDGAFIETHIQIQYEGDPETFAWVIPVMTEPEIQVGSQALFDNLLASTVPNFGTSTSFDCTDNGDDGPRFGCGVPFETEDLGSANDGWGDETGGEGDGGDGGPDILQRGTAGAFEYVILSGGTIDGVVTWLDDNGFAQDDDAPPILEHYLDQDFVFVAVKLQSGAGVEEIQPLVVRYEAEVECFPLILTSIAAVDNMAIRAFFAGDARAVPTNFALVEPNWALLDWANFGANYLELVTMAIDEAPQGHGWVTEYADTMNVVPSQNLLGPTWSSFAFAEADITSVVDILENQNLMSCNTSQGCQYWHPLVEPLLNQFIPVPEGVSSDAFYSCLECHDALLDSENWDPQAFADTFAERIVEPGKRAEEIIEDYPFLTRMFTTISPHEMTEDPLFHQNEEMGTYTPPGVAVTHIECEEPDWTELPNGQAVHHNDANGYPEMNFEDMPAAATVWNVPAMGAPQAVVDNADAIEDVLKSWNKAHPLHGEGSDCAVNRRARHQGLFTLLCLVALGRVRRRRS